jgi:nucleotide-binding universal stress UspA family protein
MTFRHILVPTDFGEPARHALDFAVTLAQQLGADLTLLHAISAPASMYPYMDAFYPPIEQWQAAGKAALDAAVAELKKRYPRSEGVLTTSDAAQGILDVAKKRGVDLIVMGTHGRRGLSRVLLGSVAEKTVRSSPVPVLTVSGKAEPRSKEAEHRS